MKSKLNFSDYCGMAAVVLFFCSIVSCAVMPAFIEERGIMAGFSFLVSMSGFGGIAEENDSIFSDIWMFLWGLGWLAGGIYILIFAV